jgi:hypothetical protein
MDNEELIRTSSDELISLVLERLGILGGVDLRGKTAEELLKMGVVDPIKLFIKNEPHKEKKFRDKKFRLISNVSLVDQLVDRIVYSYQNMNEIDTYEDHPSKPGMGLHDEGLSVIWDSVQSADCRLSELDVSSWDWTVNGFEYYFDALLRIRLYDLCESDWLSRVILNRHYCASLGVFLDSGGVLYAQVVPGVMKSGWYNTGSSNSHISCFMAYQSGSNWCICMGDDVLKEYTEHTPEFYESMGHIVKMHKEVDSSEFEFCSTLFKNGVGYPVNVDKTVVRLLGNKSKDRIERDGLLDQFRYVIRHHPDRAIIDRAATAAFDQ